MLSYATQHPINIRSLPPGPHVPPRGLSESPSPARSPGFHLGSLVRSCALDAGHYPSSYQEDDLDILIRTYPWETAGENGTLTRIMVGFAWESYIAHHLDRVQGSTFIHQPGEIEWEGIFCSRDGFHFDAYNGVLVLDEIKATFKSSRRPVCEDVPWMWQAAGYCYATSMVTGERCLECEFHPLYIRGDYKGIDPQYLPQMVEFEWEELVSIWNMLVKAKKSGKVKPEKGN